MCYKNPRELLRQFIEANPLVENHLGHTALDDFEHFCAYTGLSEESAGSEGFDWAKLAYVSVWTPACPSLPS